MFCPHSSDESVGFGNFTIKDFTTEWGWCRVSETLTPREVLRRPGVGRRTYLGPWSVLVSIESRDIPYPVLFRTDFRREGDFRNGSGVRGTKSSKNDINVPWRTHGTAKC